jgi:hypothetical protein
MPGSHFGPYPIVTMTKVVLITLSVAIMGVGLTIYASGHRRRESLKVPLLSRHSKFFVGGSVTFFGLVLLAVALLHVG